MANLENCVQATASNKAQQEIIYRSYVFLGYLFYENLSTQEGSLSKAVTALRMVPKTSYYYADALLGLGWTALKARQWADCISAGTELVKSTDNLQIQAEGELLQAYASILQKNYPPAVTLLTDASNKLGSYSGPSKDDFSNQTGSYKSTRVNYDTLAGKVNDLGTTRQSTLVLKEIDSLHVFQKDYKDKIDSYLKYSDDYTRRSFFAHNLQSLKEDVDYALAKAQKLSGGTSVNKVQEKTKVKEKELNDQINKLRDQLKQENGKPEDNKKSQ